MLMTETEFGNGVSRRYVLKDVDCGNDIIISAVSHDYSYGGNRGLWEIAVWNQKGEWLVPKIFPEEREDVIGWLTEKEMVERIKDVREFFGVKE